MKVAVIGSRNFNNYSLISETLQKVHETKPISLIISGGAVGADSLAEKWAKLHNIPTLIFMPDWKQYGKKAGLIRNTDIIQNSDSVIAFWNGSSKGTKDSITKAKKLNKPILVVRF